MFKSLSLILFFLLVTPWSQAEEKYEFNSEQQRLDFVELNEELRCPKCQNQNIAGSNALIATDMKRKVYELLKEGNSKDEIVHFMKVRYGDFVHYNPPMTPVTLWLYLGPALFIALALSYFFFSHRNRNRSLQTAKSSGEHEQRVQEQRKQEQRKQEHAKLLEAEKALKDLE